MEGIAIESHRVVQTGTTVTDVGAALTREIATMSDLLGEIRTGWQSELAAPRYAAIMQQHLDLATVLKDALLTHGESLVAAGNQFAQAEADLAGSIGGAR